MVVVGVFKLKVSTSQPRVQRNVHDLCCFLILLQTLFPTDWAGEIRPLHRFPSTELIQVSSVEDICSKDIVALFFFHQREVTYLFEMFKIENNPISVCIRKSQA
ncbi:hypothetical protein CHARACLAT_030036 [Characodon lateralis]|uniref:Uncharacterized protein n=1 Tax=Characodon lateralis TaxID=208331 RepID=A0ABU7EY30_9TELE|nr:hypothetical protein [Characodon lateralis]